MYQQLQNHLLKTIPLFEITNYTNIPGKYVLTLPAVIGISTLAYPIYTAFYDSDPLGGQVLMWYAPVALLFALFTVTAAILQGINQQKHAIVALIMGVILKFVCNVIFIRYFGTVGAILATAVGFLASVWYTNRQIKNTHTIHSVLYIKEHSKLQY